MTKTGKHNPRSTYWRRKADKVWSEVIRRTGKCIICGAERYLQAHHLIHRGAIFFRHNLENGVALCPQCHTYSLQCSAHVSPWAFEDWMRSHRPDQFAWWEKNRYTIIKGVRINYQDIYELLCEKGENP